MTDPPNSQPDETRRPDAPRSDEVDPTIQNAHQAGASDESRQGGTDNAQDTIAPTAPSNSFSPPGASSPDGSANRPAVLATVGHFELQSQIGQGGMGTVYRAFDTRFRRDIAIKVLTATENKTVSSQGKQRFINEAQITGQLQHPGIPPAHELGTLEDGRPFLAMKLVKGQTLRELLKRRTSLAEDRSRFVAIFEHVCHAIGYAHGRHVLHRDLKPANIMVGAHGEVQVMDWGLAKLLANQSEDELGTEGDARALPSTVQWATKIDTANRDDSATCTGQALGTPAYMPPEQAGGEIRKLDERSDVFGLGAILCEILTGKPPYTGKSGQEVLLKAVRGEIGDALERLEACNDEPELVALCQRCLAFDKTDRPVDGNSVAAEVTRIREAAESRARQAELEKAEALVREAEQRKRRRQVLIAAAAIVVVLAIGVAGTTVGMWRADKSRQAAEAAQRDAERARQEALKRQQEAIVERDAKSEALAKLEVALEAEREAKELEKEARTQAMAALRFMTDDAVKDQIAEGKSHLSQKKKEYLNRVIEFYEGFAQIRGEGEEARAIRAEGLYRVGKLRFYVGEPEAAQQNLKEAADLYRHLVKAYPDRPEHQHELAQALNQLSWVLQEASSEYKEGERLAKEAIAIGQSLVERFPDAPHYRRNLADSHTNLVRVYWHTSHYAEAEEEHKKAIAIRRELAERFPDVLQYQSDLARSHHDLASVHFRTSRYAEAEEENKKAIAIRRKLVEQFPDVPQLQSDLSQSHNNMAVVYDETRRYSRAEEEHKKAIAIRRKLVERFPAVPEYQNSLAMSHINLANTYTRTSHHAEAEDEYGKAIATYKTLMAQFPSVPEYQSNLASCYYNLATAYQNAGRYAEAEEQQKKAITLRRKLMEQFPSVPEHQRNLASSHYSLAATYQVTGRYQEAEEEYKQAIQVFAKLVKRFPGALPHLSFLAMNHHNLATLYAASGRYAEAEDEYQAAVTIGETLVERLPNVVQFRSNLLRSYRGMAEVCRYMKQYGKAEVMYGRALDLTEKLFEESPVSESNWFAAQWLKTNLIRVCVWNEHYDKAKALSDKAMVECETDLKTKPESKTYQQGLALHLVSRTLLLAALGKQEDAIASAKRLAALEHDPKEAATWAAMGLSLAVRAVMENEKLDEAIRRQAAETYAQEAIRMLELAIQRGYDNVAELRTDTDFDPIRDRKDFQAIVERVAEGQ